MLKFHMQAPLGYQVHMVSTVNFVFADEEKVMAELVKVRKCLLNMRKVISDSDLDSELG